MAMTNNLVENKVKSSVFILLFLTSILNTILLAQETKVRDIQVFTEEDSVIILYSLEGDFDKEYNIKLFISSIGNHFEKYEAKPESVRGDIYKITYLGDEGRIVWTPFGLEWLRYVDNDIRFEITAEKISSGIPWYYYVGGAIVTTATAIVLIITGNGDEEEEIPGFAKPPIRPQNP